MLALFGTLLVLAAIPSLSVFTVAARSASAGFMHGALTSLGIVVADIVFVLAAVYGLALLSHALGPVFAVIQLCGAAYLAFIGVALMRSTPAPVRLRGAANPSALSSFTAGFLLTFGDQKAILFYLGLFPAFLDPSALTHMQVALIVLITAVAVGGVKLIYAWLAIRSATLVVGRTGHWMNQVAGMVMLLVAVGLLAGAVGGGAG